MGRRTLNDHLFDQLDRLHDLKTPEEMDLEINRAATIVNVSEQVLKVADFKLRVIEANTTIPGTIINFSEIDVPPGPKHLMDDNTTATKKN